VITIVKVKKTWHLEEKDSETAVRLAIESGKEQGEWIGDLIKAEEMRKLTEESNPTIPKDLRKHFQSDVAKLKDATSSIIGIFTSQMNAMVVEKNWWEKSYNEMATTKEEEIKRQKDKISELEEIKNELEIKCSDLSSKHDLARESAEACKKRADEQEVWLKNSKEEISGLKQDLTQKNKLLDELKYVEVENKRLEEDLKKMKSENDSLMSKHKSETDVQVKKYNEDIAALESKQKNEIQALQKQHEENLKLKIKEVEIKCKEAALEEQKQLRDKFNDESREREKEIRKELREQMEKMQNFYQEKFEDKLAKFGIKGNAESAIDPPEHPTKKTRRPRKKLEEETK
jgi:chromosome segregation ATPase